MELHNIKVVKVISYRIHSTYSLLTSHPAQQASYVDLSYRVDDGDYTDDGMVYVK